MKSEKEIEAMLDRASDAADEGTKFSGMSYEEGVRVALEWVLEYTEEDEDILK